MDEKKLKMPHGDIEWNAFLCNSMKELLEEDVRVTQHEYYAKTLKGSFFYWTLLCPIYYCETDGLLLHINMLLDGDFASNDCLRWTKDRDERLMTAFLSLKEQIIKLKADGKDHSYTVREHSRPFYSEVIVQPGDELNSDDFTVRTYGVLTGSGIKSISQLKLLSEVQLQGIDRLGARGRQEVLEYQKRILQGEIATQTGEQNAHD